MITWCQLGTRVRWAVLRNKWARLIQKSCQVDPLLVLIAMFKVVVALRRYRRVLKAVCLTEPFVEVTPLRLSATERIRAYLLVAVTFLSFYPAGLLQMAATAARVLS